MFNVLIFILGAGMMFYMSIRSVMRRRKLEKVGEKVAARVTGVVQGREGDAYVLEFETAGGNHKLHYPKPPKGKGFEVGSTVNLLYDPDDLDKMYVEGDKAILGAEVMYAVLGVLLLALMVSFMQW